MNIVVLIKQVPDTNSERPLSPGDHTLDREATDAVLDEIDERAVESALLLKETRPGSEVTVLTMGPDEATDALRRALAMGADKAVHLSDEALHGTDALGTAKALARVVGTMDGVDLILAGNEASDGRTGAVPAMVAEVLGLPALTHACELTVDNSTLTVRRQTDEGVAVLTAELPAVVSVNEKINEPRYPSFKGIMAAKKKPISALTLADAGIAPGAVGLANACSTVTASQATPPKAAGEKVEDQGDGGRRIAAYLVGQELI